MNAPCKDCPNRSLYCHCTCEEYLKFAEERKKIAEGRRKYYNEVVQTVDSIERANKNKKNIKRWKNK